MSSEIMEAEAAPSAESEARGELEQRLEAARLGGGPERIARQHSAGKLTARDAFGTAP